MILGSAIACGFVLDTLLGDPRWLPHPICLIGNVIAILEKIVRKIFKRNEMGLLFGGFLIVLIMCFGTFFVANYIVVFVSEFANWASFAVQTFMFYQIFAMRSLWDESTKVQQALADQDLPLARKMLSYIVGRDTAELTAEEVAKGAVETVAENTADGVIAPMFYMFIGGAPLAFVYKAINTMDSMLGYKNEKYLYLGRCAAKLDDIANFIPARISALVMIIAAGILKYDSKKAWKIFRRDRYNHLSPNSAMTESVAAGALNIQLGGGHYYFGEWVHKDTIGDDLKKITYENIYDMNKLMVATSFLSLGIFGVVLLVVSYI